MAIIPIHQSALNIALVTPTSLSAWHPLAQTALSDNLAIGNAKTQTRGNSIYVDLLVILSEVTYTAFRQWNERVTSSRGNR